MRAGRMDRLIRIETLTVGKDAQGGETRTWALLAEVWAEVKPLSGTERLLAAQVTAQALLKFRIRYRDDFDETARIVYEDRNYDIDPPLAEIGRREGLEITGKLRS
jgi:SPP1 family predicted phage head-tail adaptor